MPSAIREIPKQVDTDMERRIITCSIVNTKYLQGIYPIMKIDYFQVPYARRIYGWVTEYYEKYKEAPFGHIQDIYYVEKERLRSDAEADLIEGYLLDLSHRYEEAEEDFNIDYELDRAVEYVEIRDIMIRAEQSKALLMSGKLDEARTTIAGYRKVAGLTSNWIDPNDPEEVRKTLIKDQEDRLIRFPGQLGNLLGWFRRGWLIAVQGPSKRGKSFWIKEIGFLALKNRLKVAEINLEMSATQLKMRFYQRLSNMPTPDDEEDRYLYPVFDCVWNQDGSCANRNRTSSVVLIGEGREGGIPVFGEHDRAYVPCSYYRGDRDGDYAPAVWYEEIERPGMEESNIVRSVNAFGLMYGRNNYRAICYPRFRANIDDIRRDLDALYYTDGFAPDVIQVDYADILGALDRNTSTRDRIDLNWMGLAGMGTERHALVVTATHSNLRRVEGKKRQRAGDVSEDTRKVDHLDLLAALDQTEIEKTRGIMRIGKVAYRHGDCNPNSQVTVLQQLKTGQVALDSEWVYEEE